MKKMKRLLLIALSFVVSLAFITFPQVLADEAQISADVPATILEGVLYKIPKPVVTGVDGKPVIKVNITGPNDRKIYEEKKYNSTTGLSFKPDKGVYDDYVIEYIAYIDDVEVARKLYTTTAVENPDLYDYKGVYCEGGHFETLETLEDFFNRIDFRCYPYDFINLDIELKTDFGHSGTCSMVTKNLTTAQGGWFWEINLNDRPMLKDDRTRYTFSVYAKLGENFEYHDGSYMSVQLAFRDRTNSSNKNANAMHSAYTIKATDFEMFEDWAEITFDFISYSDATVLNKEKIYDDNNDMFPEFFKPEKDVDFTSYECVCVACYMFGCTGDIYWDDFALVKGSNVPDYVEEFKNKGQEDPGQNNPGQNDPVNPNPDKEEKKGCSSSVYSLSIILVLCVCFYTYNKFENKKI